MYVTKEAVGFPAASVYKNRPLPIPPGGGKV